jgi:hypothetical protein
MDWTLPTTQVMGKFNKWTEKDTALFRTALSKTGQVIIQIQASEEDYDKRKVHVIEELTEAGFYHQHEFDIMRVPNVIHLTYTPNKNYIVEKVSV